MDLNGNYEQVLIRLYTEKVCGKTEWRNNLKNCGDLESKIRHEYSTPYNGGIFIPRCMLAYLVEANLYHDIIEALKQKAPENFCGIIECCCREKSKDILFPLNQVILLNIEGREFTPTYETGTSVHVVGKIVPDFWVNSYGVLHAYFAEQFENILCISGLREIRVPKVPFPSEGTGFFNGLKTIVTETIPDGVGSYYQGLENLTIVGVRNFPTQTELDNIYQKLKAPNLKKISFYRFEMLDIKPSMSIETITYGEGDQQRCVEVAKIEDRYDYGSPLFIFRQSRV